MLTDFFGNDYIVVCKNVKNQHILKWTNGLIGKNYRVATLSHST